MYLFFPLFFFSFKCACTFSFQNMQTGHVQQSRHGKTIREQPVPVGSLKVWLPYSFFFFSLLQNCLQISAPTWQHTKMIQDHQTTKQSTANKRATSAIRTQRYGNVSFPKMHEINFNNMRRGGFQTVTLGSSAANNLQPKSWDFGKQGLQKPQWYWV